MADLGGVTSFTAIYGSFALFPGIFPVLAGQPPRRFDVEPRWDQVLVDEKRGLKVDARDCILFRVTHLDRDPKSEIDEALATELSDDSLLAISECLIWLKKGSEGRGAVHARQVGRIDVRFFSIPGDSASKVIWNPPVTRFPSAIHGIFPRIRMTNGPASSPTSSEVRRFMAAVDLWNLGFFTEAFIASFSLLDDTTQEVLRTGLRKKGLKKEAIDDLMRAIKERRLETFLTTLTDLAGWSSLKDANKDLLARVLKANAERNRIMHGSSRLSGEQSIEYLTTVRDAIGWLAENPFGKVVPQLPPIQIISPQPEVFDR